MKLFITPDGTTLNVSYISIVFPVIPYGAKGWNYYIRLINQEVVNVYMEGTNSKEEAENSRNSLIKLMESV